MDTSNWTPWDFTRVMYSSTFFFLLSTSSFPLSFSLFFSFPFPFPFPFLFVLPPAPLALRHEYLVFFFIFPIFRLLSLSNCYTAYRD